MTWNCHVDDSSKDRYDVILGRDLLKELGLNLTFSEHVIEAYYGPFKESKTPMVDLVKYIFKILNEEKITPGELFTDAYVEEVYGSTYC